MPPRLLSVAIVLFWLGTTGWLFQKELWPMLRPGQAPPFNIDLSYEAQRHTFKIRWNILRDGEKIGRARTWIVYRDADDMFEMHSDIDQLELNGTTLKIKVPTAANVYCVNREGELRDMRSSVTAEVTVVLARINIKQNIKMQGEVSGNVSEGKFYPRCRIESSLGNPELTLEPVPVPQRSSFLNPLHPLDRLTGVRKGQHWRVPYVNPLSDSLAATLKITKLGPTFLDADVEPEVRMLSWNNQEIPCLVIDYHGADVTAATWIKESDGTVMQQDAKWGEEKVTLQRE